MLSFKAVYDRFNTEFIRFLFVGGFAALVNVLSRILLDVFLNYLSSIMLAYIIGMATAYALNRLMVFGAGDRNVASEMLIFTLVNLFAVAQTILVSLLLARVIFPNLNWLWHPETLAHAIGVAVPVISSYFGHKYWSFGKRKNNDLKA